MYVDPNSNFSVIQTHFMDLKWIFFYSSNSKYFLLKQPIRVAFNFSYHFQYKVLLFKRVLSVSSNSSLEFLQNYIEFRFPKFIQQTRKVLLVLYVPKYKIVHPAKKKISYMHTNIQINIKKKFCGIFWNFFSNFFPKKIFHFPKILLQKI